MVLAQLIVAGIVVVLSFLLGRQVGKSGSTSILATIKSDLTNVESKAVALEASAKAWILAEVAAIKAKIG